MLLKISKPNLQYAVTRPFPWSWFGPTVYIACVPVLVILITVNYALTGYNIIVTTTSDFNTTQNLWYHRFAPAPRPGTLCDPYQLSIGDSFFTTTGIFQWSLLSTGSAFPTIAYPGLGLDVCDVAYMTIDADFHSRVSTAVIYLGCNSTRLPITAKAVVMGSYMLASSTRASTLYRQIGGYDENVYNVAWTAAEGGNDLLEIINTYAEPQYPVALSLAVTPYCSAVAAAPAITGLVIQCETDADARTPQLFLNWNKGGMFTAGGFGSWTENQTSDATDSTGSNWYSRNSPYPQNLTAIYIPAVYNWAQLLLAAARLDIARNYPNNVFLNISQANTTLYAGIPGTWGPTWAAEAEWKKAAPNGAYIAATYACRLWHPKTAGSAFIAVVVATQSIFSGLWAGLMFAAGCFVVKTAADQYASQTVVVRRGSYFRAANGVEDDADDDKELIVHE